MTDQLDTNYSADPDSFTVVPKKGSFADRRTDSDSQQDDERAQPGDVIGIESKGETTELGDTAEDEDERRREVRS